jgi:hypothetical protein
MALLTKLASIPYYILCVHLLTPQYHIVRKRLGVTQVQGEAHTTSFMTVLTIISKTEPLPKTALHWYKKM